MPEHVVEAVALAEAAAQICTLVATNVEPRPALSFVSGDNFWAVFHGPEDESSTSTGGAGITGVKVELTDCPKMSVTRYVSGVLVPDVTFTSATKVTMPVEVLSV